MSLDDHRESAYDFRRWMQAAQAEIDQGTRTGVRVIHRTADPRKVSIWTKWRQGVIAFRKQA